MSSRSSLAAAIHFSRFSLATSCLLAVFLCGCGANSPSARVDGRNIKAAFSAQRASLPMVAEAELVSQFNTEAYDAVAENDFVSALDEPQSTFAIDVDTASYANVRRLLREGRLPPAGAVRLEELVNYFDYSYPQPVGEHPFSVTAEVAACPWNTDHQLLRVALQGKQLAFEERQPSNLVFLLDVSGSMMSPNKLPLVKSALQLLTKELGAQDRIAIVVYAGASGLVIDSTSVEHANEIDAALERLSAGGSTNGGEGIELAYRVAKENYVEGGINRVILCTDGDFNVGTTSQSALVKLIQEKAESGVFLSVLGFGSGNLKDSMMEKLADKGNGNYAYIDSPLEARKVLVEEIGGTLITIAKDVKIQVDFNPTHVQGYRLLGYENRMLENQDFRDDSKDAGEIGSGHSVTAFYELIPTGSTDSLSEPRSSEFVSTTLADDADQQTRLTVNLRYKFPQEDVANEFQLRVPAGMYTSRTDTDFGFASAVLAYGMLLRESQYAGDASWDWIVGAAEENLGTDARGLRAEFVQLAKTARRLSETP